ncbi:MAG: tetratricopeptide repeat protein [Firmicutes bacterium]|nr:tetratricopeptide repeat protein [Bacillota bacterium]
MAEIVCPLCRKEFKEEIQACDRCGTDLTLLISLHRDARSLVKQAEEVMSADAALAASLIEQAQSLWPEVPQPPAREVPRDEGKAAGVYREKTQVVPRVKGWHKLGLWIGIGVLVGLLMGITMSFKSQLDESAQLLAERKSQIAVLETELAGTQRVAQEEIQALRVELGMLMTTNSELMVKLREQQSLLDVYRFRNIRDSAFLIDDPGRFHELKESRELLSLEHSLLDGAMRTGAIQLFEEASEKHGQWDPARRAKLLASLELWPTGYQVDDVYFFLAELSERDDPLQAIAWYEKVLEITHGWWYHDDALYAIGRLKASLGDYQGAVEAYRQVLRDWPKSEGARLARIALREMEVSTAGF